MMEKFRLGKKNALITGASKGLGKAIAESFASVGANIAITSRNMSELSETRNEIVEKYGVKVYAYEVDHSDWKHANAFIEKVKREMDEIHILVNNAGTGLLRPIEDMTDDEWDYILSLNINNYMALCRGFVPDMKKRRAGKIINIASLFGVTALENRTAYCSSKGAVISFTRALAIELAPYNINVNSISCGAMRTPLMTHSWNDPVRREYFKSQAPLGRWGEPEDIAGTALLLASEAGSYITGQNIIIDGGWSAK